MTSESDRIAPGSVIGLTTTIPVEVVLAAGCVPLDLNNLFITAPDAYQLVGEAEAAGFPRTVCAWIKGIYAILERRPDIAALIVVTQGDCSNTHALMELLTAAGRRTLPFAYPFPPSRELLRRQMERLLQTFGVDWQEVHEMRSRLAPLRRDLAELDRLTWETGQVTGQENFGWLIASSDFNSDAGAYARELTEFLAGARARPAATPRLRLGLAGIPPIFSDLFEVLEELGAGVVFNEIPRQFAMLEPSRDLVDQYLKYTYPYDVFGRIEDIGRAVRERRLDGLIHYTQSFCFRQIQDRLLRQRLELPILTIEGDRPGALDHRTRMRLEAFVDVLRD